MSLLIGLECEQTKLIHHLVALLLIPTEQLD